MIDWRFMLDKYVLKQKRAHGFLWDLQTIGLDHEPFNEDIILNGHRKLMVDAGANAGRWAIPAASHFDRIMAFEPLQSTARLLRKNIAMNHVRNVDVIEKGLSDDRGLKTFYLYEGNEMNSLLPEHIAMKTDQERFEAKTEIQVLPLDDYYLSPDLLKVDVEGWEREVLRGAKKTIERSHPVLLVEVHLRGIEDEIENLCPSSYEWVAHYRDLSNNRKQTHLFGKWAT